MKRTGHGKQEEGSGQESSGEKEAVPVEEEEVSEEFPSDLQILTKLLDYCEKKKAFPQEIDRGLEFGQQFGAKVHPAKVANRVMELEHQYLEMAGKSESSLVLPEDEQKRHLMICIWDPKYGHTGQIEDIKFLRNIFEYSTKKQDYPSGKDGAKRIKKLQKKYLTSLKLENGIAKYSMSPDDEEFFRLSSIIWGENAAGPEEGSSPTERTLDDVPDIEILSCMIGYYIKNKAYPLSYFHLISFCRNFLHIDIDNVFSLGERVARLRWKHMVSSYDQQLFKWSRMLWGDTLGVISDHDSAEEIRSGSEEDGTDKNKNHKKDESPKT